MNTSAHKDELRPPDSRLAPESEIECLPEYCFPVLELVREGCQIDVGTADYCNSRR